MLKSHDQLQNNTDYNSLNQSKSNIIVEIIEYLPNALLSKTIIKKSAGNISVMSFNTGSELIEKICPFDTYLQIIDGKTELVINKESTTLKAGEGVVIPANTPNYIKPNRGLKMILSIIKPGDE